VAGFAVGPATVVELRPVDGDQLYVYAPVPPEAPAANVLVLPLHIVVGLAVGTAATEVAGCVRVTVVVPVQLLPSFTVIV